MTSLFLDCLVYNYLVRPPEGTEHYIEPLTATLRRRAASKDIVIVGSLDVLEEIMKAASSKPGKYAKMVSIFWELIGTHLLRPWRQRLFEELRRGRRTSPSQLYLGSNMASTGRRVTKDISKVNDFLRTLTPEETEEEWEEAFTRFADAIRLTPRSDIRQKMETLRSGFPTLVQDCFKRFCGAAGVRHKGLKVVSLPCNHAFLAYNLMRLYERGRYGKEYKPSDSYDAAHFIDASSCTYLVTEDKRFRESCERVPGRTFHLLTIKGLGELLGCLP